MKRRRLNKTQTKPKKRVSLVPEDVDIFISGLTTTTRKNSRRRPEHLPPQRVGNRPSVDACSTYKASYPALVAQMVLNGAVEKDLVVALQITRPVFRLWKLQYPEFAAALSISKDASLADEAVKRSIYEMALGYEETKTKLVVVDGVVERIKYTEPVAKNFNAAKFWLENRDPENWRKAREPDPEEPRFPVSITPIPLTPQNITNINFVRNLETDNLESISKMLQGMMTPGKSLERLNSISTNADEEKLLDLVDITPKPEDPTPEAPKEE